MILIKKFSFAVSPKANHKIKNISWKIPFNLAAEPRSSEAERLTFPYWLPGLDKIRTWFWENLPVLEPSLSFGK